MDNEMVDVDVAFVDSNHILFHSIRRQHAELPPHAQYLRCPFTGERSAVNKIVKPTHDADVTKFWKRTQWISDEIIAIGEVVIAARDEEGLCCLLKRLDRVLVDQFGNFNLITNVIAFENALKYCITARHTGSIITGDTGMDENERTIFGNTSIYHVGQDDLFASLHPIIRVQLLFQNEDNIRSSIVDGRKRLILLYRHYLGVDGVI
jgi:hypothetical protein